MIKTERFTLQPLLRSDKQAQEEILAILNHPDFSGFMGLGPSNPQGNLDYLESALRSNETTSPPFTLTIKKIDQTIGVMDCLETDGEKDLGYFIAPSEWRKGVVTECLPPFLRWVFTTHASVKIMATTHPDNIASAKILSTVGFINTGSKPRDYNDGHKESLVWTLSRG